MSENLPGPATPGQAPSAGPLAGRNPAADGAGARPQPRYGQYASPGPDGEPRYGQRSGDLVPGGGQGPAGESGPAGQPPPAYPPATPPPYPQSRVPVAPGPRPPGTVIAAIVIWVASALYLAASILLAVRSGALSDIAQQAADMTAGVQGLDGAEREALDAAMPQMTQAATWLLVAIAAVQVAASVWLARGSRVARVVLTCVGAFYLLAGFSAVAAGGFLFVLLAGAGIVLMYVRPSAAFLRAARDRRLAARQNMAPPG